ncbi:MAG: DUF4446 family protein [Candidatus Paceibacterota bacterium]
MTIDSSLIIYILLALVLILSLFHIRMEMKLRKFLLGRGSKNLDDTLAHVRSELKEYLEFKEGAEEYLKTVELRLRKCIQGNETIRFNPFKGSGAGGNQSFATAFVNENGDGVVLSSLYGRDHVSVFAKPIKKFSAVHELSAEEKDALTQAQEKLGIGK